MDEPHSTEISFHTELSQHLNDEVNYLLSREQYDKKMIKLC